MTDDFRELRERYEQFTKDRDWAQFHDPKSLILALVGEVGELAELFQWVPADKAAGVFASGERRDRAGQEMADVLIYLIGLSNALGIDLLEAANEKLSAAEVRFPVEAVRGVPPFKK